MGLPFYRQLILQTLTDPRAAARRVMSFGISYRDAMLATALVAALAMMLAALGRLATGPGPNPVANALTSQPIIAALYYFAMTAGLAAAATVIGGWFGGTGRHAQALGLFAWFQAMTVLIQAAQLILLLALPPLAMFLSLLALGWMFWALGHFLCALHGFRSVLKVLLASFISLLGLLLILAIVLSLTGITLPGVSGQDV